MGSRKSDRQIARHRPGWLMRMIVRLRVTPMDSRKYDHRIARHLRRLGDENDRQIARHLGG